MISIFKCILPPLSRHPSTAPEWLHELNCPFLDTAACKQGVLLDHNTSERYESRFVTVKIQDSPSIMLQGMADSILGIWVAHGEGNHAQSL